jgi:hypothetical protein
MVSATMVSYFLDVVSPTLAPVLEPAVVDTAPSMFPMALYAWTSVAGMACALGCVSASGKKHQVQRVSLALVLMLASASMSNATMPSDMRPDARATTLSSPPLQEFSYLICRSNMSNGSSLWRWLSTRSGVACDGAPGSGSIRLGTGSPGGSHLS